MVNIINGRTGAVLYSSATASKYEEAIMEAYRNLADLTGASLGRVGLRGADLAGVNFTAACLIRADLRDANLTGAILAGAILAYADFTGAILTGADFTGADLTVTDFIFADLTGAILRRADARQADFTGAILEGVDFTDANLVDADVTGVRDDIWAVLSAAPHEAAGLLEALRAGRVDGAAYSGACAGLIGTIANCAHIGYENLPNLRPDMSRPAEQFFLDIHPGDTPETSRAAKLAADWVGQWISSMEAAFGRPEEI